MNADTISETAPAHTNLVADPAGGFKEVPVALSIEPEAPVTSNRVAAVGNTNRYQPATEASSFFEPDFLGASTVDPCAWDDKFVYGPFTLYIRKVSNAILQADDDFPALAIQRLALSERAGRELTEDEADANTPPLQGDARAAEIKARALVLLEEERFRSDSKLSSLFDQMLKGRYLAVILGKPDSTDPAEWGGLVTWGCKLDGKTLEFSEEAVRGLKPQVLTAFYEKVMALSRYGLDDARFRRAASKRRR